ncbi:WXG100 family type VII secretion target [Bacillus sp. A301a_S52]|nr:WXG100 family type VII secretion target [Bacillus sp. A301a_S52]
MAGQIRVTPEELNTIAAQYLVEGGNVNGVITNLDGLMDQLRTIWEGASSEAFSEQYEALKPSFLEMVELLEKINRQLKSTASSLEQADADIAAQIKR